jgi:hypothetical protein
MVIFKKYLLTVLVAVFITAIIGSNANNITFSDYKDILSALLNVSSIIFAIIGAWIAIIYPTAISKTFGGSVKDIKANGHDPLYLSELVEIVLISAAAIMAIMAILFLYPILKNTIHNQNIVRITKIAGLFTVTLLTVVQLWAVFRVILANYFFLNELSKKEVKDRVDELHR